MTASTVLIVNDNTAARDALVEALQSEGFAVMAYASAAQCLTDCDFRGIACAIVNHAMQDMTGLDLAKVFQSGWLAIPTILLADSPPAGSQDSTAAGVIAVLGLPPDAVVLCALVRKVIGAPSQAAG